MPTQDFGDFVHRHTLVLNNVPVYERQVDAEGKETWVLSATKQTWTIPPFPAETELTIRELESKGIVEARMKPKEGERRRTLADYWAPIVAAMVTEPILQVEDLRHYPAQLLREVGEMALDFFRYGKTKVEEDKAETPKSE